MGEVEGEICFAKLSKFQRLTHINLLAGPGTDIGTYGSSSLGVLQPGFLYFLENLDGLATKFLAAA